MEPPNQTPSSEQVVQELSKPLLRYLGRYVGDPAVAEDLLQETLIRIARGLPNFAGRASLKTWAFTIATRVATDYFRSPDRRFQIVEIDEASAPEDGEPQVYEQLVLDEMNACVRQVIDSLPDEYRAALVLHDLEGMTADQAAKICGCSVATAKIRIHRARLRLRAALQKECSFYHDSDNVLQCDRKP